MSRPSTLRAALIAGLVSLACAAPAALAADAATLAKQQCATCHGDNGVSTEPTIPTIAGMSAKYVGETLKNYRKKVRACPEVTVPSGPKKGTKTDMCKEVASLSDADTQALGKHYAALKFVRARQAFDAAKAKQGQKVYSLRCEKCHEKNGTSPDEDNGILAGQWLPYLREQMASFRGGKRPIDEKMKLRLDRVNKEEEEAVLQFFASQQ